MGKRTSTIVPAPRATIARQRNELGQFISTAPKPQRALATKGPNVVVAYRDTTVALRGSQRAVDSSLKTVAKGVAAGVAVGLGGYGVLRGVAAIVEAFSSPPPPRQI